MKLVSAALVKAQRHFAPALKSSTNPHFKSRYADLAACVEAVVDALNEAGIMLMQRQHPNESGVSIETIFIHESGEMMSAGILSVPASKQDPQGYGSALTYARRYSLMAACGIAPEDDDGNAAKAPKPKEDVAHSGPAIAFSELQPDVQTFLRKATLDIIAAMPDAGKAVQLIEMVVDNYPDEKQEVKAGLWSLLDSKTRSAIKAHQKAL